MPTAYLGARSGRPDLPGPCSLDPPTANFVPRRRASHPSVSAASSSTGEDRKEDLQRRRARRLTADGGSEQFIHPGSLLATYTRDGGDRRHHRRRRRTADMLTWPAKPAGNSRVFTDDVIDYRLAFLTRVVPTVGPVAAHHDTLTVFPYLRTAARPGWAVPRMGGSHR